MASGGCRSRAGASATLECGLQGIERDLPRGAPPVKVDVAKLVELTTQTTPEAATHWSTRKMAAALGVSASTVMRHWQANGLKPHLVRGFKVSRDPKFVEKLEDIVGLYMSPPEHALVLCCDEKSQVQALDRTQPGLPLKKGRAQTMTHDYKRNGTTTLFAALNVLDGQVIGQCQQRHTHAEWLKFLRKIDRETPKDKTLHLIADNYATHKHPAVQEWLAKHPRFHMHFTPTSASWLNMVERFFRDITTKRLRRGVFTSVPELVAAIDEYVAHHNTKPKPFIWTKSAARHPAEGHSRQQPLKFQTECNTTLGSLRCTHRSTFERHDVRTGTSSSRPSPSSSCIVRMSVCFAQG